MKLRHLIPLILVAAALVAAVVTLRETPETSSVDAGLYFPELNGRLNDVTTITSRRGEETATLERVDGVWTLAERGGFPVDVAKVRSFLKGMGNLTKLEAKTDKEELYTKLDLEDPTLADTKAIQFTLSTEDGSEVADIIIGKDRSSTADLDKRDLYVRSSQDPQSWLVESDIKVHREHLEWMDRTIVTIHRDRIEQLFIDHPFGDDVFLNRDAPNVDEYKLKDMPDDKQLEYQFQLKDMANVFTSLDFDDVAVEEDIDFGAENVLRATLDTFDGMRIVMQVGDKDGERWARFLADESGRDIDVDMELSDQLLDSEAVAKQVAELNEQWKGWIYRVRDFKFETLTRAKNDLLTDKTDAPADAGAADPEAPQQSSFMELPADLTAPIQSESLSEPDAEEPESESSSASEATQ